MSLPYYKRYPRDFIEGTIGMPLEIKGAYSVLLDLIYVNDGRLPDDARYIAGALGCTLRKWTAIRSELIERRKIQVSDGIVSSPILEQWEKTERRPAIPLGIRRAVKDRDGEKCLYCGSEDGPFHLDHIHPWSRGGEHAISNLVVACAPCNLSKRDKTLEEWLQ